MKTWIARMITDAQRLFPHPCAFVESVSCHPSPRPSPLAVRRGRVFEHAAFTLIELLVVIAILGILLGILLPVLARSKDKGRQAVCISNLKQLATGMTLYHGDYNELFPAAGSRLTYGPQPEDWIWWQYGRDIQKSAIARHVSGFQPKLFTCPSDKEGVSLQGQGFIANDPYRYSYTLTSYNLTNSANSTNQINLGMATIITQSREVYAFRADQIRNPSKKLMLVEEDRRTIDDPRWIPHGKHPSLVAERHGKKGTAVFADGHIEAVTPKFGLNPTNSHPGW